MDKKNSLGDVIQPSIPSLQLSFQTPHEQKVDTNFGTTVAKLYDSNKVCMHDARLS